MSAELIISIISLVATTVVGVLTLIVNHKVSKINNIKEYKENNRHITPFELQFKDEDWLYDLIMVKDEFYKYDVSSQKRIVKWFADYAKTHILKKLKVDNIEQQKEEESVTESDENLNEEATNEELLQIVLPRGKGRMFVNTDLSGAVKKARIEALKKGECPITIKIDRNTGKIIPTTIITDLKDRFDDED